MMMTRYKLIALLSLCLGMMSCKKVLDLQLGDSSSQLVIEGNITDQIGPQSVLISRSVPFGNTNTFPKVSGATVKILDNNGRVYNLTERAAGTYTVNQLLGRAPNVYTLQVQVDGQTYTAKSTMPARVDMDSLSITTQSFGNTITQTIGVYYQDPAAVKNQYRYTMFVNGVQVNSVFVRNDEFSDGRSVQALLYQDDITIKSRDRVDLEIQCIDPVMYNYWYTLSRQSGFNNSATPSNPPNNFDNNVLGYFSAHTLQRRTVVVP